jgi:hypothetical protein
VEGWWEETGVYRIDLDAVDRSELFYNLGLGTD